MIHRARSHERPKEPKQLTDSISLAYAEVPLEFLISDIRVEDKEGKVVAGHIILPSPEQMKFLRNAATWYLDRTIKADLYSFVQLFGIHSFLRCSDSVKQVPLVNVLMSRRTREDYTAVFKELIRSLGDDYNLEECVLDFEQAAWNSLREAFPDIQIHGCQFHYSQAIFRKVQALGLAKTYKEDSGVSFRQEVKMLFALPLLPQRDMVKGFEEMELHADPRLTDLMQYMRSTWFNSSVWKPANLCSYQRLVRTNNDVECYHRRLNQRCVTAYPSLYKLLDVIHNEARLVELTAKLISSNAVGMTRSKKTTEK